LIVCAEQLATAGFEWEYVVPVVREFVRVNCVPDGAVIVQS
jgi:hypothetical protein